MQIRTKVRNWTENRFIIRNDPTTSVNTNTRNKFAVTLHVVNPGFKNGSIHSLKSERRKYLGYLGWT